ncbi:hypothetical protein BDN72DRAFT_902366 [Pluteus cervinus]|uniref:Uncharacterized protein n=1 Tax=Pluteus cervinus TaxID=181527 RepID=A0ACD3AD37_9AGAR|nr:hypothetical protein BDN72DRAFT_902366 [Pluteus cervinus]
MSPSDNSNEPRLPPELEESVFIQAILHDFSDAFKFTLVAKRVHHWLIPHIFNIVIFHNGRKAFPMKFDLPIFQRYAKHVHHLFLEPMIDDPYPTPSSLHRDHRPCALAGSRGFRTGSPSHLQALDPPITRYQRQYPNTIPDILRPLLKGHTP